MFKSKLKDVFDISDSVYQKHKKRVCDIVTKANGDIEKEKRLATTMADKIRDVDKAFGRYLVAEELNNVDLGKIFLKRFKDLTYTIHDWRKEKIEKFLEENENNLEDGM